MVKSKVIVSLSATVRLSVSISLSHLYNSLKVIEEVCVLFSFAFFSEYPKIVKLLKGLLIPVHDRHRQKLKEFAKDMFERLNICDILPYLLTKRVLAQNDVDELRAAERHESRGSAAMQLLSTLPNRNEDWFELFLSSLLKTKQRELAIIIDKDMTESMLIRQQ